MKKIILILSLFVFSSIKGQTDSTSWEHFIRLGIVNVDSTNGGFGYYRLNRTTLNTFRDLRLFAYELDNNSFIYLRYKSSDKYLSQPKFYRYTITSLGKTQEQMSIYSINSIKVLDILLKIIIMV